MNKCERCGREFRTVQELRGHQTIEYIRLDLHRGWTWAWTLLSSHFIAIVGAIIGGAIGSYPAVFCGWAFFSCAAVLAVIGGVIGGGVGYAVQHLLLFRREMHPRGEDSAGDENFPARACLIGCLSLLGLGFLGVVGSLIFWLVGVAVSG